MYCEVSSTPEKLAYKVRLSSRDAYPVYFVHDVGVLLFTPGLYRTHESSDARVDQSINAKVMMLQGAYSLNTS